MSILSVIGGSPGLYAGLNSGTYFDTGASRSSAPRSAAGNRAANERACMRINTLNSGNDLGETREALHSRDSEERAPSEINAALRSEIANLQVSSQNVTASDSHVAGTEMSAEMRAYTESQMQPTTAAKAILELLQ